jgi:hypothetical protein
MLSTVNIGCIGGIGGIGRSTENVGNIEIGPMLQTSVIDTQGHRRNLFLLSILWSTNFDIFNIFR